MWGCCWKMWGATEWPSIRIMTVVAVGNNYVGEVEPTG